MSVGLKQLLELVPQSSDFKSFINALSSRELYGAFRNSGESNFIKYLKLLEKEYSNLEETR